MARGSAAAATILTRLAAAAAFRPPAGTSQFSHSAAAAATAAAYRSPLSRGPPAPPSTTRPFWSPPLSGWCGAATMPRMSPFLPLPPAIFLGAPPAVAAIARRPYSKRPKKWQGGPHAYVQVEPGAPCPPYSPNAGSVKKRKHNKRMAQRHAFAKAQAHVRKQQTKAALIKRDAARRKRWRDGAARVRAWAKHLREQQQQQETAAAAAGTPLAA